MSRKPPITLNAIARTHNPFSDEDHDDHCDDDHCIGKNWNQKKVSEPVSKNLVPKKSRSWYRKKLVAEKVSELVSNWNLVCRQNLGPGRFLMGIGTVNFSDF